MESECQHPRGNRPSQTPGRWRRRWQRLRAALQYQQGYHRCVHDSLHAAAAVPAAAISQMESDLDFSQLGSITEQTSEMVDERTRYLHAVAWGGQSVESGVGPHMATYQRRRVGAGVSAKVGDALVYRADWRSAGDELDSAACACTVTKEKWSKRVDVVRRSARGVHWRSRLDAQRGTHFVERHFQLPTANEPGQDLLWRGVQIGAERRLGAELAAGIADEHGSEAATAGSQWSTRPPSGSTP